MNLTETYWQNRYKNNDIPWDIGYPNPQIIEYILNNISKTSKILFPGAGNGREAQYLFEMGFQNIHILDYAQAPIQDFKVLNPTFPDKQIHFEDFFKHNIQYDVIVEQTFFCALDRNLRSEYVKKIKSLFVPSGILIGLLFGVEIDNEFPPYGGGQDEYESLFSPYFEIIKIELAENSFEKRKGKELWIEMNVK